MNPPDWLWFGVAFDELMSYAVPAVTVVPTLRASCEQQYGELVLYDEPGSEAGPGSGSGSGSGATGSDASGTAPNSCSSGAGRPPNALPGIQRPIVGTSSPKVLYSVISIADCWIVPDDSPTSPNMFLTAKAFSTEPT